MMISIINNNTDKLILTFSAFTTLFLSLLSLTKKNSELNKLIMISKNKNIKMILNMCKIFVYEN